MTKSDIPFGFSGGLRFDIKRGGVSLGSETLERGTYSLGATSDADIVLPVGPQTRWMNISVKQEGPIQTVVVVSTIVGLCLNGLPMEPGTPTFLSLPVELMFDREGIVFALRHEAPPSASRQAVQRYLSQAVRTLLPSVGSITFGTLLLKCGLSLAVLSAAFAIVYAASAHQTAPADENVTTSAKASPVSSNSDSAALLKSLIRRADLANVVTVSTDASGIVLSGTLSRDQGQRLHEVLAPVAAKSFQLDIRPLPADAPGRHLIAAVDRTKRKSVIGSDGRAREVGETIGDGWRIEAIEAGKIILRRAPFAVAISY